MMKPLLVLLILTFPLHVSDTEDLCRQRLHRCRQRCAEVHKVGSRAHLKCNDECRRYYLYCREEEGR
jgi:hypothetical protein